jgi:hypothetical protein
MTPKAQATKTKLNKWDYTQTKKFLHNKENNEQNEMATFRMGKTFASYIL